MNQHTGWETAERTHTKPECTRPVTAGSLPAQRAGGRRFCFHKKEENHFRAFLWSLRLPRDGQMSRGMETLTLSGKSLRAIAYLLKMFRFSHGITFSFRTFLVDIFEANIWIIVWISMDFVYRGECLPISIESMRSASMQPGTSLWKLGPPVSEVARKGTRYSILL